MPKSKYVLRGIAFVCAAAYLAGCNPYNKEYVLYIRPGQIPSEALAYHQKAATRCEAVTKATTPSGGELALNRALRGGGAGLLGGAGGTALAYEIIGAAVTGTTVAAGAVGVALPYAAVSAVSGVNESEYLRHAYTGHCILLDEIYCIKEYTPSEASVVREVLTSDVCRTTGNLPPPSMPVTIAPLP
jgi:hypothetical protein